MVVILSLLTVVPDRSMKSVFVLGDSISMHYGPYLEEALRGVFVYDRKRNDAGVSERGVPSGANGGDSRMILEYLKARKPDPSFRPDILLLNCGLHDIKRNVEQDRNLQVSPEDYRKNLEEIDSICRKIGSKLVWVRTTPVVDEIHNSRSHQFHRYEKDLAVYNEIADRLFEERGVPILDLHQFTKNLGEEVFIDHVHYNQETRARQGAFIAGFLQNFR